MPMVIREIFRREEHGDVIVHPDRVFQQYLDSLPEKNLKLVSAQQTHAEYAEKGNRATYTVYIEVLLILEPTFG